MANAGREYSLSVFQILSPNSAAFWRISCESLNPFGSGTIAPAGRLEPAKPAWYASRLEAVAEAWRLASGGDPAAPFSLLAAGTGIAGGLRDVTTCVISFEKKPGVFWKRSY